MSEKKIRKKVKAIPKKDRMPLKELLTLIGMIVTVIAVLAGIWTAVWGPGTLSSYYFKRGEKQLDEGKYEKARSSYLSSLKAKKSREAVLRILESFDRERNYLGLISYYKKFKKEYPGDYDVFMLPSAVEAYKKLAMKRAEEKRFVLARKYFREAFLLNPDVDETADYVYYLLKGRSYYNLKLTAKENENALKYYKRALSINPGIDEAVLNRAEILLEGKYSASALKEVLEDLENFGNTYPENVEIVRKKKADYFNKFVIAAVSDIKLNSMNKAMDNLKKADGFAVKSPDDVLKSLVKAAESESKSGNDYEAEKIVDTGIKFAGETPELLLARAGIRQKAAKYSAALEDYKAVIKKAKGTKTAKKALLLSKKVEKEISRADNRSYSDQANFSAFRVTVNVIGYGNNETMILIDKGPLAIIPVRLKNTRRKLKGYLVNGRLYFTIFKTLKNSVSYPLKKVETVISVSRKTDYFHNLKDGSLLTFKRESGGKITCFQKKESKFLFRKGNRYFALVRDDRMSLFRGGVELEEDSFELISESRQNFVKKPGLYLKKGAYPFSKLSVDNYHMK